VAKRRDKTSGSGLAHWCDRLGELTVLLLVVGVPFLVLPEAQDPFRLPKLMAAEVLGLTSLAAFAVARVLEPAPAPSAPGPSAARPALVLTQALLPFVTVVAFGLAVTDHPFHTRQAMVDFAIGLCCLVGWATVLSGERLERLLKALVVPGVAMALLGAAQLHDLYQPYEFSRVAVGERLGVTARAGNAGDLGVFLVLPALIAQWRLASGVRGFRRWAWLGALGAIVYGLAATQTLTALAALALGSGVFWTFALPRRRRLPVLGAAAAVLVLVVLAVAPLRERVVSKAGELGRLDGVAGWNSLLSGRLDGWRAALHMFGDHPLAGVGLGAYRAEFGAAKLEMSAAGTEFFPDHVDPYFANAHSEPLEVAAEQGLLGLVALGWLSWILGRHTLRPAWGAAARENLPAGAFLVAALAAVCLMTLVDFPLRVALVAYPMLLLLAWAVRWAADRAGPGTEASP
jgi:O-antigen ligase